MNYRSTLLLIILFVISCKEDDRDPQPAIEEPKLTDKMLGNWSFIESNVYAKNDLSISLYHQLRNSDCTTGESDYAAVARQTDFSITLGYGVYTVITERCYPAMGGTYLIQAVQKNVQFREDSVLIESGSAEPAWKIMSLRNDILELERIDPDNSFTDVRVFYRLGRLLN